MGSNAYFYNSHNGDRVYDADSMTDWLLPFFTTGVFNGQLQVTSNDDMSVTIDEGYCNIAGKTKHFDDKTILDIETASGTLNRIDNVILRRDDSNRDIYLLIQKGRNAAAPSTPEIIRGGGIYDLKLAEIYIAAGSIKITQANITDCRMLTDACGWVASTVEQIDFTQIQKQFDSYLMQFQTEQVSRFVEWFDYVRSQFSDDAVGALKEQIDKNKEKLDGIEDNANNYSLPSAAAEVLGGIKTGYTASGKNYAIQTDLNGNAYVYVPWNDTDTRVTAKTVFKGSLTLDSINKEYESDNIAKIDSYDLFLINTSWGLFVQKRTDARKDVISVSTTSASSLTIYTMGISIPKYADTGAGYVILNNAKKYTISSTGVSRETGYVEIEEIIGYNFQEVTA